MLITLIFSMIGLRVWYLAVPAHGEHVEMAERPQRREVISLPERGVIYDRFGEPLALNRIQYNAAILYDQIREIPYVKSRKISWRQREKSYPRKEYVHKLATLLSNELGLEEQHIEDVIYSLASLFPNRPFVLKENISETSYYRLKALQRDYPGIATTTTSKRFYPYGPLACDIIGTMGAINQGQYSHISSEVMRLRAFLEERADGLCPPLPKGFATVAQVEERLSDLNERAYTLNTQIGKGGIEGRFDLDLRGTLGKSLYRVDMKGRIIDQLKGGLEAENGRSLTLSISSELQDYAEKLLSHSEWMREKRFESAGKDHNTIPSPWIKGGAIVAMIPSTGEIVACASYPRFDPNDFIAKNSNVFHWLESPRYFGEIWDGKRPLTREFFNIKKGQYFEQSQWVDWDYFLETILAKESPLKKALHGFETLYDALSLAREPVDIFDSENENHLFYDLIDLLADHHLFSETQLRLSRELTPNEYRRLTQSKCVIESEFKGHIKEAFHRLDFNAWRQTHFQGYLKARRAREKEQKRVNKPYIDLLHAKERELFNAFWERHHLTLLRALVTGEPLPPSLETYTNALRTFTTNTPDHLERLKTGPAPTLLDTMRSFNQLKSPLRQRYRHTPKKDPCLKDLAKSFAPHHFGYLSSEAYNQATPQGSIFKLVTALEAMRQHQLRVPHSLTPLTIIDDYRPYLKTKTGEVLGKTLDGKRITRRYKGGTLPRSRPEIGLVNLPAAIERSSNLYFSLLASDVIEHPLDLVKAAKELGFGQKLGIDLPGEYGGLLPQDLRDNRTGLYAFAIGQHSLVVTPLQTASMLATLVNGGRVLKPQICKGEPVIKNEIEIAPPVQRLLIESMSRVVNGEKGSARPSRIRGLYEHPPFLRHYLAQRSTLIGKTSTAEINYRPTLDPAFKAVKAKHTWFGGVSFEDESLETPELVVVVYLKYGDYGKEAAPLASEIVHKWRQIAAAHPPKVDQKTDEPPSGGIDPEETGNRV